MSDRESLLDPPPPTPFHRAGSGPPLVLLHGLTAGWPIWRPVLPALEREHDVFAPTLPGHWGGPPLSGAVSVATLADATERILDEHGIGRAHLVGNSLGGWLAIELGRRERALSVTGLSPAGGWTTSRELHRVIRLLSNAQRMISYRQRLGLQSLVRRPRFRKLALAGAMQHGERVAPGDAWAMIEAAANCDVFVPFMDWVKTAPPLARAVDQQDYPIRIAWGENDKTLPLSRYGTPVYAVIETAERVSLPGCGHVPMYDDPNLVAGTILEVTQRTPTTNRSRSVPNAADITIEGERGEVIVRRWDAVGEPTRVVVIAHGYGEHGGRYDHVAQRLAADGAVVYAPDHHGHGRSDGEMGLVDDVEPLARDLRKVIELAHENHPALPMVLIGHSLGGVIVTRYVQHGDHGLDALVLSGPVIGGNPGFAMLLEMDPIPDIPIDPAVLSRDPAVGEAYAADDLVYHGPLSRATLEAIFAAVEKINSGPAFGSLPTLWIHGSEDQLAPVAATRPAIEHVKGDSLEEHIYEGAAHEVFNETNKDEVLDDVTSFINAKVAGAAV